MDLKDQVASGTHGCVYKSAIEGEAIKRIKNCSEVGVDVNGLRELGAVSALKDSEYVIKFTSVMIDSSHIDISMPLFKYDLKKFIQLYHRSLSAATVKSIMFRIIYALYEADKLSIGHRDVKPHNILIDDELNIKVADWGLSRFYQTKDSGYFTDVVQTVYYRCPELFLGIDQYDSRIDVWSIGIIFYELLTNNLLFISNCCIGQLMLFFQELGTPTEITCPNTLQLPYFKGVTFPQWEASYKLINATKLEMNGVDLLKQMLNIDHRKRINFVDALNHDYFKNLRTVPILSIPLKYSFVDLWIDPLYMTRQRLINHHDRTFLIDYILNKSKMESKTIFLAVQYMDLFLSHREIIKSQFQLVGCVALLIASKMNDIYPIDPEMLVRRNVLNMSEFLSWEIMMVKIIMKNLYSPTRYLYMELLCQEFGISDLLKNKVLELLKICALDVESLKYTPYEVALGCIHYVAPLKEFKNDQEKSQMINFNDYLKNLLILDDNSPSYFIYARYLNRLEGME